MTAAMLALVLAAAGTTNATPPPPPLEVLEAGQLDYDVVQDRGIATGGVVLRRGQVMLHAESAAYDALTGEVEATGNVLLTEPGRVVAAQAMHALLDGPFEAHDVVAFLKNAPLDLSRCRSLDEGRKTGQNRVTFGGTDAVRDTPDHFEVEHARITLCDCGGAPPSWEIHAHHADVIPGKRAILTWPVFYITPRFLFVDQPVPVLVLPALYLPLGERQSGLLMPVLNFGVVSSISQPLFLALGRSWDATVSADYVFAGPTGHAAQGPGTSLELRWAPAEGMSGQFHLSVLHSLDHQWPGSVAEPPGFNRLSLSARHEQRISDQTYYKLDVGLIGDPLYVQDFTADALLRGVGYRRSAFAIEHRSDDVLYEADAAYHLPMLYLDSGNPAVRAPFGVFGSDLSTFHRLPSASATLLPVQLIGPVQVSGTAGIARFAPLRGATGDEGANGIGPGDMPWSSAFIDQGERDGRWTPPSPGNPGERLAATRALARAELRAPITLGNVLEVEPYVAATAVAYAFEAALSPQVDAHAIAGLALSTKLERTYGSGANTVRHEIEPAVEWRGGTSEAGPGLPNYAYDEFDVALPARVLTPTGDVATQRMLSAMPGAFSQLRLSLRNRLIAPAGALSNSFLEVVLGQDLDAATGTPSETWARGTLRLAALTLDAFAGVRAFGATEPPGTPKATQPSALDAFTELGGNATVSDTRGDNVHANLIALGPGGSPRFLAGLEPFFDPRPYAMTPLAQGQVGFNGRLGGAIIGYDAFFYARGMPATTCGIGGKTISTSPHIFQHAASMVWDSPCHCWKAGFTVVLNECLDAPQFGLVIDLSALGAGAAPH